MVTFEQTNKALVLGFLAGFIWNLFGEGSVIIYHLLVTKLPSIEETVQQNSWIQPARDLVGLLMIAGYVFIIIRIFQRLYKQVELPENNKYTPWLVLTIAAFPGLFIGALILH